MAGKGPEAFRTISEVAETLDLPQHVLRFWETRFTQIKPMKRGGGRRYYRPEDVELLRGIRTLLYGEGYTIRGVQRILREQGPRYVIAISRRVASARRRPSVEDRRDGGPGGRFDERREGRIEPGMNGLPAFETDDEMDEARLTAVPLDDEDDDSMDAADADPRLGDEDDDEALVAAGRDDDEEENDEDSDDVDDDGGDDEDDDDEADEDEDESDEDDDDDLDEDDESEDDEDDSDEEDDETDEDGSEEDDDEESDDEDDDEELDDEDESDEDEEESDEDEDEDEDDTGDDDDSDEEESDDAEDDDEEESEDAAAAIPAFDPRTFRPPVPRRAPSAGLSGDDRRRLEKTLAQLLAMKRKLDQARS